MDCTIKLVNWNIGGAKYLETKCPEVQRQLQGGLNFLVEATKPHVICLQEFTQFAETGNANDATDVVECPDGYLRYVVPLIDTDRHSHQGKWNKVRKKGKWKPETYFSQGNAIFVRKDLAVFPVWSLPSCGVAFERWRDERINDTPPPDSQAARSSDYQAVPEDIILQPGFYRGTRDTEPRAATALHLVIDRELPHALQEDGFDQGEGPRFRYPLDVFIVNTHLTTLTSEREGVPAVDVKASQRRLGQLDILFDDMISEYNIWTKDDFRIRGEHVEPLSVETHDRYAPVWILCGDFNFTPESAEYRYVKDRNFMDLSFDRRELFTKAKGQGQDPTLTLDYVFAGPAFEALEPRRTRLQSTFEVSRRNEVKGSDHYPICVSLQIIQPDDLEPRCKTCQLQERTSGQ